MIYINNNRSVEPLRRYARLQFFQDGGRVASLPAFIASVWDSPPSQQFCVSPCLCLRNAWTTSLISLPVAIIDSCYSGSRNVTI